MCCYFFIFCFKYLLNKNVKLRNKLIISTIKLKVHFHTSFNISLIMLNNFENFVTPHKRTLPLCGQNLFHGKCPHKGGFTVYVKLKHLRCKSA